jgi:pimeloyl-ACP methyl ester carboxylesterase
LRERRLTLGSTSVLVREWGDPGERAVFFWPGGLATGLSFNEAAPVLAAAGHRVVAVDPPGSGKSPALSAEEYEIDALVRISAEALDALGASSVVYVGHS